MAATAGKTVGVIMGQRFGRIDPPGSRIEFHQGDPVIGWKLVE